MPPKVRVSELRKRYGTVEAVAGIDFEIQDGEIFGLLGPNGAGKTTTIECVLGLTVPDAGTVEICGIDARRHPQAVREKVGAALQTTSLQDRITPREALRLFGAFYRSAATPETLLERFSLSSKADVAVDTLSGGQQQRLALALAFVNNPALVFLDEPTAGLDAHSRRELHAEIQAMRRDGHTVLLTTHHLDEADLLCDRIAIISKGRIVATGSPRDLVSRSARLQQIRVRTDRPVPAAILDGLPGVVAGHEGIEAGARQGGRRGLGPAEAPDQPATRDDRAVTLRSRTPAATVLALVSALESRGIDLEELHVQRATLEDVFVDLTETQPAELTP